MSKKSGRLDFGADFGDLLIQHEHVLSVILFQSTFLPAGRELAKTIMFYTSFQRFCLCDESMTCLFFHKIPTKESVANCTALWRQIEV